MQKRIRIVAIAALIMLVAGSYLALASTTVSGSSVTLNGYVYELVESPQCYPQCGVPSFLLTYLYVPAGTGCTGAMGCYPPPQYYRLLNMDGSPFRPTAANGTYAIVTGNLVTPSSWNCDSFFRPKVCMSGDIYLQNIAYVSSIGSNTSSAVGSISSENSGNYVPIPGFQLASVLLGLVIGLVFLMMTRYHRIAGQGRPTLESHECDRIGSTNSRRQSLIKQHRGCS